MGDLEELQLLMQPLDAAALKERATARFKAGDMEGAIQAFSLLLEMPEEEVRGTGWLAICSTICCYRCGLAACKGACWIGSVSNG